MIRGIVFDKDGTLFDFNATWGAWCRTVLVQEAGGDPDLLARLAAVLKYDLAAERFQPGSPVVAETVEVIAQAMLTVLEGAAEADLIVRLNAAARQVPQVEATPLQPFFAALKRRGLRLGVATNDAESSARAHLEGAGVLGVLDFLAGYDSGYGGKPEPGQLTAFCQATGLQPGSCVMVGDSLHDLQAGRAAGMGSVGVLTGPALTDELAPHCDVVLPSIAALAQWLDEQDGALLQRP